MPKSSNKGQLNKEKRALEKEYASILEDLKLFKKQKAALARKVTNLRKKIDADNARKSTDALKKNKAIANKTARKK